MTILADRAGYRYPRAESWALRNLTLEVGAGEFVGVVGPNGSGKTTLIRLLLGVLSPAEGSVAVFGRPAVEWKRRDLARRIGVVSQREEPAFPLKVRQAVTLGRYPHLRSLEPLGVDDRGAVDESMEQADVAHLADRWTATLSGGEWQRVRIARALAQRPDVLVLDEPTANLDIRHEMETFDLVEGLVRRSGLTCLVVTHHVNLAARFVDRLVMLAGGVVTAQGTPGDVLRSDVLEKVFGWPVATITWGTIPQFVPLKRDEKGS